MAGPPVVKSRAFVISVGWMLSSINYLFCSLQGWWRKVRPQLINESRNEKEKKRNFSSPHPKDDRLRLTT